jgi:hypothetical protein
VDDRVNDAMEVRAWVHVVGDARGDDRQDVPRSFSAFVEPGK